MQTKITKTITATFRIRGTEQDIRRMKARIASLTVYEQILSMHLREHKEDKNNGN